jgi:hypothetical protein
MDRGILAQQSDVRCKRERQSVIMIAPVTHTSKGLAKAFVSSAGGKGPELFIPPFEALNSNVQPPLHNPFSEVSFAKPSAI